MEASIGRDRGQEPSNRAVGTYALTLDQHRLLKVEGRCDDQCTDHAQISCF